MDDGAVRRCAAAEQSQALLAVIDQEDAQAALLSRPATHRQWRYGGRVPPRALGDTGLRHVSLEHVRSLPDLSTVGFAPPLTKNGMTLRAATTRNRIRCAGG